MARKFLASLLSVILLSLGWLGISGFGLLVGFVPLLWISSTADTSRRGWWGVFGWSALTFALWNLSTIWWIWFATPIGPFAATLASTTLNMIAFMLFHTLSKRGTRLLGYVALAAAWIMTEYWYTVSDFSFPWLVLGNGFSHEVWAVQWYDTTGVFGGSLWVLLSNIAIFEALQHRSWAKIIRAAAVALVPLAMSLSIWFSYDEPNDESVEVSIIQPNVDCYDKFNGNGWLQQRNIIELIDEVPIEAQFILLPETAVPRYYYEPHLGLNGSSELGEFWVELSDTLAAKHPDALLITGANTIRSFATAEESQTQRKMPNSEEYYDVYNTAVGIDAQSNTQIYHKGRLVIGVENTPTWIFDLMRFLVIDLGGTVGQIGKGAEGEAFEHNGVSIGASICYEGLYGDYYGDFVRDGAEIMTIISNDGWWGNTPGHTHLFSISRLRAIEHRRAIARSANTGKSGFISPRGDVSQTLTWDKRGVITQRVPLNSKVTFYTKYGDYIARIAQLITALCVLCYIAYRVRQKDHLNR